MKKRELLLYILKKDLAKYLLFSLTFILLLSNKLPAQWVQTNGPYGGSAVHCFAISSSGTGHDNLYVGTGGGIFITTDNGTTWSTVGKEFSGIDVMSLAICKTESGGTNIIAGCFDRNSYQGGVFLSTNNGDTWTKVLVDSLNKAGSNSEISSIFVTPDGKGGTNVFASFVNTYLSTDNGVTWHKMPSYSPGDITGFAALGTTLFIANGYIWKSTDNGNNWKNTMGVGANIAVSGTNIFAGGSASGGIVVSTDAGASWKTANNGLPKISQYLYTQINAFAVSGTNVFAGTANGIFLSTDNGSSWNAASSGLTDSNITALAAMGTNIFAGTNTGVFLSTNNGADWNAVNIGLASNVQTLSANQDGIGGTNIYAGTDNGIFLSTDNGTSWNSVNSGLKNLTVNALATTGASIYAGTNKGIFISTDNGMYWTARDSGSLNKTFLTLAADDSNIFAGGSYFTYRSKPIPILFHSNDNGASWNQIDSGLAGGYVSGFAIDSSRKGSPDIYAATTLNPSYSTLSGIYHTTDNGADWSKVNTVNSTNEICNEYIQSIGIVSNGKGGTNLIAATFYWIHSIYGTFNNGLYLSTDGGVNWATIANSSSNCQIVKCFASSGTNIFSGSNLGVYLSTDGGWNWTEANSGLLDLNVKSLLIKNGYVYAGTYGGGVWKRPLSELTSVNHNSAKDKMPGKFSLSQNYPNPFNPSTTIGYTVPKTSFVSIKIYDMLGREVVTLVNEEKQPGNYNIKFAAGSRQLASGIYLYRMKAGSFEETKKLILLK